MRVETCYPSSLRVFMALAFLLLTGAGTSLSQSVGLDGGEGLVAATGDRLAGRAALGPVFDPNETGWASIRNATSAEFSDDFNARKADNIIIDIEVLEINGLQRVAGVWMANPDNRGWQEHRNLTSAQFSDKWTELRDGGYRLIDQESYVLNGTRYYAGIWIENVEGYAWASLRNLTSQQFSDNFQTYSDAGYVIVDVEGYVSGSETLYSMIWVDNTDNLQWAEHRNLTTQQFSDRFAQYQNDYRLIDVESYQINGSQFYAGIWIENTNGRAWAEYRDLTETGYRNRWYRQRDLGYRIIDFEVYETNSGIRYAGIWRQNDARVNWSFRTVVDNLVSTHQSSFGVPGIAAAVMDRGEIVYSRGYGHQDVDAGVWYSARTINRLASVSKGVAGILAMKLTDARVPLDLDSSTARLVPTLPSQHTHTLRQLLSNRSGIGHYDDHGSANAQFDTALDGASFFINDALPYQPGDACKYSTHAYTVLGAALEAHTGDSIGDLVMNQLSAPFGLNTLKAEDRSVGDQNRSLVYDSGNNEATPDNISWKVLGGGLEASAFDLARLGSLALDGSILSGEALAEMQVVPDPNPCIGLDGRNLSIYALGWNIGVDRGNPRFWKGGNQLGANTYMILYPQKEIVIVVLSNRDPGHSTGTLAFDIAEAIVPSSVGIDENASERNGIENDLDLTTAWPNPSDESASIMVESAVMTAAEIRLYDSLGREVLSHSYTLSAGPNEIHLSVSNLPSGMYFVRVITGSQKGIGHLVVSR